MTDVRVEGVLFSPDEQALVRRLVEHWEETHCMVDWRNAKFNIPVLLDRKLAQCGVGSIDENRNRILWYNDKLLLLVDEFDANDAKDLSADQWEKWGRWIKSKKWSFPIAVVFIGLPLVYNYAMMVWWIGSYIAGETSPSSGHLGP